MQINKDLNTFCIYVSEAQGFLVRLTAHLKQNGFNGGWHWTFILSEADELYLVRYLEVPQTWLACVVL